MSKPVLNRIDDIKVLYVEDDSEIRNEISTIISPYIKNLFLAANGKEGLKTYKKELPEIVITDIRIPEINGLEMCRKIKKIHNEVQIIVTSAYSDTSYFIDAIDIGVNQYVLKPIKRKKLFDAINKSYGLIKLQKEVDEQYQTIIKLYQAIEQSSSIFIIIDSDKKIKYVNPKFLEVSGFSLSEILSKEKPVTFDQISSLGKMEKVWKILNKGKVWKGEYKNYKKSGESYWEFGSISPVTDEKNKITSFVNVAEDITELKRITEALKRSEDKHRSLTENLGEGIGILDLDHNFTFCNPALKEILGTDKLIGKNICDFSSYVQYEIFVEKSKVLENEKKHFDLLVKIPDKQEKILNITLTPQINGIDKKITGSFCIFKDITRIVKLIEQKEYAKNVAEQAFKLIEEKNQALNDLNSKLKRSEAKLFELNQVLLEYIKATGK